MPSLTREQSREVDRIAMEELEIPGIVLMENAARGVAEVVLEHFGENAGHVAIACGPGNNGGDGLAVARHLHNRAVDVVVHLVAPPEAYREGSDAATNLRIVRAMELPLVAHLEFGAADLIVDALFGTGLSREIRDPFRDTVRAINRHGARVVSVDLPSGLDANTGRVLGNAVRADFTATMVAPKVGFALADGPAHIGRVTSVDIGVPPAVIDRVVASG